MPFGYILTIFCFSLIFSCFVIYLINPPDIFNDNVTAIIQSIDKLTCRGNNYTECHGVKDCFRKICKYQHPEFYIAIMFNVSPEHGTCNNYINKYKHEINGTEIILTDPITCKPVKSSKFCDTIGLCYEELCLTTTIGINGWMVVEFQNNSCDF